MAAGLLSKTMGRLSNMSRISPTVLDDYDWLQGLPGRNEFNLFDKIIPIGIGTGTGTNTGCYP